MIIRKKLKKLETYNQDLPKARNKILNFKRLLIILIYSTNPLPNNLG